MKKRVRIVNQQSENLSPIDFAVDEMRKKVTELNEVVYQTKPDLKQLQLKLQGCVSAQVSHRTQRGRLSNQTRPQATATQTSGLCQRAGESQNNGREGKVLAVIKFTKYFCIYACYKCMCAPDGECRDLTLCLCWQVNAGPLAYAEAFLKVNTKHEPEKVDELKVQFR